MRISRKCIAILLDDSGLFIEDCGQREGIFVNGEPTTIRPLSHGDRIRLGTDDACQLIFRLAPETIVEQAPEIKLRSILGSMGNNGSVAELNGLRLLLEATSLMLKQESILENIRLIDYKRERQRLAQEMQIAREIQPALVLQRAQHYSHFSIAGLSNQFWYGVGIGCGISLVLIVCALVVRLLRGRLRLPDSR